MKNNTIFFYFFLITALSTNFGFVYGDIDSVNHHNKVELFLAIIVNYIALILKIGDQTTLSRLQIATSLVACVQLTIAAIVWWTATYTTGGNIEKSISLIVSLSAGALVANLMSIFLMVTDNITTRR